MTIQERLNRVTTEAIVGRDRSVRRRKAGPRFPVKQEGSSDG